MTRAEIKAHVVTLGGALGLIVLILAAQGLSDRIEREADARIDYQKWLADACTPGAGQTAVAANDGRQVSCTIYSKTSIGYAREVVSVAVLEVPQ
jgi:hypothetical protein